MSSVTGEASQNRCPHLAPTAASSHRIRGVPGRTLPCSCLSPKIKRASEQKSLPSKGWRRLAPAASGCTSRGTKPSTHELRARHAGVAGEGLGALGGALQRGPLVPRGCFWDKTGSNWEEELVEGTQGWISQLGDEQGHISSISSGCLCHKSCLPPLAGGLAAFPCRRSSSRGGIFHAGILAGARCGGVVTNGPRARVPAPWGAQVPFHPVTNSCCQLDVLT